MGKIYYLNWDQEIEEHGPASELFHKLTVKDVLDEDEQPSSTYAQEEFDQLYREVEEVEIDDPEAAWKQWNRGTGYESQVFLDVQERSMSVGDVLEIDGAYYQAQNLGWEEITVEELEEGENQ